MVVGNCKGLVRSTEEKMACAQQASHQDLIIELVHHMGYWGLAVFKCSSIPFNPLLIARTYASTSSTYIAADDLAATTIQVASEHLQPDD